MLKIIANIIADGKLEIVNPSTMLLAIMRIIALMINEKSPRVINIKGRARSSSIGFKKALSNPIVSATSSADQKFLMCTPEMKLAPIISIIAFSIHFIIMFFIVVYFMRKVRIFLH